MTKISDWFKENWAIISVMVLAAAIRIYYFLMTANQPLWWDELCYGSLAKNFITHAWDGTAFIASETALRPLIFSHIWSALIAIGLNEVTCKIILVLIPSILTVYLVYLIAKEVFNQRVALISAVIYSVLWLNLFYSLRFLVHMLGLCFLLSSVYFFIKSMKDKVNYNNLNFFFSLIFLSFATLTRYQVGIVFAIYFVALIYFKKLYLNKLKFWLQGIGGILPLLLFFGFNLVTKGSILPALAGSTPVDAPIGWHILSYIPMFLTPIFFIAFLIGIVYVIFEMGLSHERLQRYCIPVIVLFTFLCFFVFYMRVAEDRWLFETLFSLAMLSAFGIDYCAKKIEKHSKWLGVAFIIGVLIFGAYAQVTMADTLIKQKKESYIQMKDAFELIKVGTPTESIIAGHGIEPYVVYYAEREYIGLTVNPEDASLIPQADYFVMHIFNPIPPYLINYTQENMETIVPISVEFYGEEPIVITYEIGGANV